MFNYRYATSQSNATAIRRDRALTDNEIASAAPSVFAQEAHESRSERYGFIPTIDVLQRLRKEGFEAFEARQTRVRDKSKQDFTRHALRLRHPDAITAGQDGTVPEIILLNSHDGSSGYQLLTGFFRAVCSNGLIAGDVCDDIRVRHAGSSVADDVLDGCITVLDNVQTSSQRIETYRSLTLSDGHQRALAQAAVALKYDDPAAAPIRADQLLEARRWDDRKADLWSTFNRVQENLLKGGVRARSANGRRTRTRAVTSITEDVRLNRALWTLADRLAAAIA